MACLFHVRNLKLIRMGVRKEKARLVCRLVGRYGSCQLFFVVRAVGTIV